MAETEYGKYIFREPHAQWTSIEPRPARPAEASIRVNSNLMSSISCDFAFVGVSEARPQGHPSHKHEKHTINTASVVYIPKGLFHLPIEFKRVDKPFLFGHLLLSPTYSEIRPE